MRFHQRYMLASVSNRSEISSACDQYYRRASFVRLNMRAGIERNLGITPARATSPNISHSLPTSRGPRLDRRATEDSDNERNEDEDKWKPVQQRVEVRVHYQQSDGADEEGEEKTREKEYH